MKTYVFSFILEQNLEDEVICENCVIRTNVPIDKLTSIVMDLFKEHTGVALDSIYFNTDDKKFHAELEDCYVYIDYELLPYIEYRME